LIVNVAWKPPGQTKQFKKPVSVVLAGGYPKQSLSKRLNAER